MPMFVILLAMLVTLATPWAFAESQADKRMNATQRRLVNEVVKAVGITAFKDSQLTDREDGSDWFIDIAKTLKKNPKLVLNPGIQYSATPGGFGPCESSYGCGGSADQDFVCFAANAQIILEKMKARSPGQPLPEELNNCIVIAGEFAGGSDQSGLTVTFKSYVFNPNREASDFKKEVILDEHTVMQTDL